MNFFTSDEHLYHHNVLEYCARPFADVDEQTRELIARHNAVVSENDTVWHLGDLIMGPKGQQPTRLHEWLSQLNGTHHLIMGNHDELKPPVYLSVGFKTVTPSFFPLTDDGHKIVMTHRPQDANRILAESPIQSKAATLVLVGHVHEKWTYQETNCGRPMINVGVDAWDFTPKNLPQLLAAIPTK